MKMSNSLWHLNSGMQPRHSCQAQTQDLESTKRSGGSFCSIMSAVFGRPKESLCRRTMGK